MLEIEQIQSNWETYENLCRRLSDNSLNDLLDRTLFLLQHFGVNLTNEEWIAIQISQGTHFEENRFYVGHEPTLAIALGQSKSITIHKLRN